MLYDRFYTFPELLEERSSFAVLLSLFKCLEHESEECRSESVVLHDHFYNPKILCSLRI